MIILARSWKCQENYLFKNKSPFEGPDSNKINNVVINGLNKMIVLSIPKKYNIPFLPWQELYPKAKILQKHWKDIQKEAKAVMHTAPSYHELDKENTGLATHGNKYWNVFVFKYYPDISDLRWGMKTKEQNKSYEMLYLFCHSTEFNIFYVL